MLNKKIKNWNGKNVWVIGASSGIGRALSLKLAASGAKVTISSRKENLLLELKKENPNYLNVLAVDVLNYKENEKNISKDFIAKQDLIVYMAADYSPMSINNLDMDTISHVVDVNLKGALAISSLVLPVFIKKRGGHLSIVASIAGYIGLPNSSVYGATKAALINMGESMYNEAKEFNVDISIVNPGFVKTNLTAKNNFDMPFIMSPEAAANEIVKGYESGDFAIVFPKLFSYFFRAIRILPYGLHLRLVKKLVKA